MPLSTQLPPRNPGVQAWENHSADEQRVFTRLQAAYAAMLDHADRNLARLIGFLEHSSMLTSTIVLVTTMARARRAARSVSSIRMVRAMRATKSFKLARIDEIGGPKTHWNFPHGWAMAANTPLRRYKQNTHGGGVRDPLVICWPERIVARGELRHQFAHACD